jgi:hypothetical protein
MTDHLGYEKHDPAGHHRGNTRNGKSPKTLKGDFGDWASKSAVFSLRRNPIQELSAKSHAVGDPPTCDRKRDCAPSWNEFLIFLYVQKARSWGRRLCAEKPRRPLGSTTSGCIGCIGRKDWPCASGSGGGPAGRSGDQPRGHKAE